MVVSILITAITLGEKKSVTNSSSQAKASGARLTLIFSSPNLLTVVANTDRDIAGVDVVIKFDTDQVSVLPSSLVSGNFYTVSGGIVDEISGTFSFSALRSIGQSATGPVATFNVAPVKNLGKVETEFQFREGEGATAVIEEDTGENILNQTSGVKVIVGKP